MAGNPLWGGETASRPLAEIGSILAPEAQQDSALARAMKTLSRPGFALRALAAGDVEAAGKNLAQLALDIPTGGFVAPHLSLTSILGLDPTGDLTDRGDRYEVSDTIRKWGFRGPESVGGKLALDLVGGVATDPLTFLTMGGSGLGKGALKGFAGGLPEAFGAATRRFKGGEILYDALSRTPSGRAALATAEGVVAAQPGMRKLDPELVAALGGGPSSAARLERYRKLKAVEHVVGEAVGEPGWRFVGMEDDAAALLDDGLDVLYRRNMIRDPSALRLSVPFTGHESNPLIRNFWSKVGGYGTLPGLVRKGLHAFPEGSAPKALAQQVDAAAASAWEWAKVNLYDKTLGAVPEALKFHTRDFATKRKTADFDDETLVNEALAWLEPAQREALTEVIGEAHDLHHRLLRDLPESDDVSEAADALAWSEDGLWQLVRGEIPDEVRAMSSSLPQEARAATMQKALGIWGDRWQHYMASQPAMARASSRAAEALRLARARLGEAASGALGPVNRSKSAQAKLRRAEAALDAAEAARRLSGQRHAAAFMRVHRVSSRIKSIEGELADLAHQRDRAMDVHDAARRGQALEPEHGAWARRQDELKRQRKLASEEAAWAESELAEARAEVERIDGLASNWESATLREKERVFDARAHAMKRRVVMGKAAQFYERRERVASKALDGAEKVEAAALKAYRSAKKAAKSATDELSEADMQSLRAQFTSAARERARAERALAKARERAREHSRAMAADEGYGVGAARRARTATLEAWVGRRALLKALEALPGVDPERLESTLSTYFKSMEGVYGRLKELGILEHGHAFYFPFQASSKLAAAMGDAAVDQKFGTAIRSVFDQRRKFRRYKARDADLIAAARERIGGFGPGKSLPEEIDPGWLGPARWVEGASDEQLLAYAVDNELGAKIGFVDALEKVAADHGFAADELADVVSKDLGDLWLRRMRSFRMTEERAQIFKVGRERFGLRPGDAVDAYVSRQFKRLNARKDWLSVLLGGGRFTFKHPDGTQYAWPPKDSKRKWRGLNYYYKPALTVLFPSFHGRNAASAVVMSSYDPDLSLDAVKASLLTIRNAPALRALTRAGAPRTQAADFLAAIAGDAEAVGRTARMRIGSYSGEEVLQQLKGSVRASGGGAADLWAGANDLPAIGKEALETGKFEKLVGYGAAVSDWIENSFRVSGYLSLVGKGVEPTEAARRIARAYVNYDRNSVVERVIRDVVPFARFQIGITPVVAKEFAQRPRTAIPFARAMGSTEEEDKATGLLPEDVRAGVAIKIGDGKYITSLGLPFEPAAAVAEGLTSFAGARRLLGGGIQPVLRTPLEAITNRSFFFGGEFGEYRRAPGYVSALPEGIRDKLTTKVELPGGATRYEVPSEVHDWLINAGPWSRVEGLLDRWFRPAKDYSLGEKLVQSALGVRIRNVDELREIKNAITKVLQREARAGRVGTVEQFFARTDDLPEAVKVALEGLPAVKKAMAEQARADDGLFANWR